MPSDLQRRNQSSSQQHTPSHLALNDSGLPPRHHPSPNTSLLKYPQKSNSVATTTVGRYELNLKWLSELTLQNNYEHGHWVLKCCSLVASRLEHNGMRSFVFRQQELCKIRKTFCVCLCVTSIKDRTAGIILCPTGVISEPFTTTAISELAILICTELV